MLSLINVKDAKQSSTDSMLCDKLHVHSVLALSAYYTNRTKSIPLALNWNEKSAGRRKQTKTHM